MPKATENLISFPQESSGSCLDQILRDGAREMLGRAIEDEVAVFVGARSHLVDDSGHRVVVRNGHLFPGVLIVASEDTWEEVPYVERAFSFYFPTPTTGFIGGWIHHLGNHYFTTADGGYTWQRIDERYNQMLCLSC